MGYESNDVEPEPAPEPAPSQPDQDAQITSRPSVVVNDDDVKFISDRADAIKAVQLKVAADHAATVSPQEQAKLDKEHAQILRAQDAQFEKDFGRPPEISGEQYEEIERQRIASQKMAGPSGETPQQQPALKSLDDFNDLKQTLATMDPARLAKEYPAYAAWLSNPRNAALAQDNIGRLKAINDHVDSMFGANKESLGLLPDGLRFDSQYRITDGHWTWDSFEKYAADMKQQGIDDAWAEHQRREVMKNVPWTKTLSAEALEGAGVTTIQHKIGWLSDDEYGQIQGLMSAETENLKSQGILARAMMETAPRFAGMIVGSLPLAAVAPEALAVRAGVGVEALTSRYVGERAAAFLGRTVTEGAIKSAPINAYLAAQTGMDQGWKAGAANFAMNSLIFGAVGGTALNKLTSLETRQIAAEGASGALKRTAAEGGKQAAAGIASTMGSFVIDRYLGTGEFPSGNELLYQTSAAGLFGGTLGALAHLPQEHFNTGIAKGRVALDSMLFGDNLKKATALAKETKLNEVAPGTIPDAVHNMLGDNDGVIYMQASDWRDTAAAQGLDPAELATKAGVGKEYTESLGLNKAMAIPAREYFQAMEGVENTDAFAHKAKPSPDAPTAEEGAKTITESPEEIKRANDALNAEMQKAMATADPSSDKIYDDVKAQLTIAKPEWNDKKIDAQAKLWRAHFKVMVDRFNAGRAEGTPALDAYDLYRKTYDLKVSAEPSVEVNPKVIKINEDVSKILDMIERGEKPEDPAMAEIFANVEKAVHEVGGKLSQENIAQVKSNVVKDIARRLGITEYEQGAAQPSFDIAHLSEEAQVFHQKADRSLGQFLQTKFPDAKNEKWWWDQDRGNKNSVTVHASGERSMREAIAQLKGIGLEVGDPYINGSKAFPNKMSVTIIIPEIEYNQDAQGRIKVGERSARSLDIDLLAKANLSTFLHESAHAFFEVMGDLAEMPGAPESIKADYKALLDWLGVEKRSDIGTEHHEKIARGFERYLREGKAPVPELKEIFDQFKNWLRDIYRVIAGSPLAVKITPEVRGIFDRMLASENAITMVSAKENILPLFPDVRPEGMTDDQYLKYKEYVEKYRQNSIYRVERKAIDSLIEQQSAAYKKEREEVENGVSDVVNKQPVFVAIRMLQDGVGPDGKELPDKIKLDKQQLIDQYGEDALDLLPGPGKDRVNPNRGKQIYSVRDGSDLEVVAAQCGFATGDDMVKSLIAAPSRKETIEKHTEGIMSQRHPDPVDDLGRVALEALYTNDHAKVLMAELDSLARQVGQKSIPLEILRNAAKANIESIKVRDVRPAAYHDAAVRAAHDAMQAVAEGKFDEAFAAQQRRILNEELYRAATDAAEQAEKIREYAAKWNKKDFRDIIGKAGGWEWTVETEKGPASFPAYEEAKAESLKNNNAPFKMTNGYLENADVLLDQYSFKRMSNQTAARRESLGAWILRRADEGDFVGGIPEWVANSATKIDWKNLTVSELNDIHAALRNIEVMAKLKNEIISESERISLQEVVDKLAQSAEDSGRQNNKYIISKPGLTRLGLRFNDTAGWATKIGTVVRMLDSGIHGFWADHVLGPLNRAAEHKVELEAEAVKSWDKARDSWGKYGKSGKREFFASIGEHLTLENRIMIALNAGCKDNRAKMLDGHKWTEEQLQSILDTLDKKDLSYIDALYRIVGANFSEVQAQKRRTTGSAVEKVESAPIITGGGTSEGGYLPIKYDNSLKLPDLKEIGEGNQRGLNLRNSFTQARTAYSGDPLRLTFDVISSHIHDQALWLSHQEALRNVKKIINDPKILKTVNRKHGTLPLRIINDTLIDLADNDSLGRGIVADAYRHTRTGGMMAAMAFKTVSSIVNLGGLIPAATRVNLPKALARSIKYLPASVGVPMDAVKNIHAVSSMMRNRFSLGTVSYDLKQIATNEGMSAYSKGKATIAYLLQNRTQFAIDHGIWETSYNKALKQHDPEKAVRVADQDVIDTQGGGHTLNLSRLQRADVSKIATTFYGWGNTQLNLLMMANRDLVREVGDNPFAATTNLLVKYAVTLAGPAIFEEMIRTYLQDKYKDKDDDEKRKGYLKDAAQNLAGLVPLGREISTLAIERKITAPLAISGLTKTTLGLAAASDEIFGDDLASDASIKARRKREIEALGIFLPGTDTLFKNYQAYIEDPVNSKQLIFGPQSKN